MNASSHAPRFLHQRYDNGQQNRQRRCTTTNRPTCAQLVTLYRRHARMGAPSDRCRARVPLIIATNTHMPSAARAPAHAGDECLCELMGAAVAGLCVCASAANSPCAGKRLECVQCLKATQLLRTNARTLGSRTLPTRYYAQGVSCSLETIPNTLGRPLHRTRSLQRHRSTGPHARYEQQYHPGCLPFCSPEQAEYFPANGTLVTAVHFSHPLRLQGTLRAIDRRMCNLHYPKTVIENFFSHSKLCSVILVTHRLRRL